MWPSRVTFLFLTCWVRCSKSHTRLTDVLLAFCFLLRHLLCRWTMAGMTDSSHWCPCRQPAGPSPPSSYLKMRRGCPLASASCSHLLHPSSVYRSPAFSFPSLQTRFNPVHVDLLLVHFCPPPSPPGSRQTSCLTNSKAFASEFSGCPVRCGPSHVNVPQSPVLSWLQGYSGRTYHPRVLLNLWLWACLCTSPGPSKSPWLKCLVYNPNQRWPSFPDIPHFSRGSPIYPT